MHRNRVQKIIAGHREKLAGEFGALRLYSARWRGMRPRLWARWIYTRSLTAGWRISPLQNAALAGKHSRCLQPGSGFTRRHQAGSKRANPAGGHPCRLENGLSGSRASPKPSPKSGATFPALHFRAFENDEETMNAAVHDLTVVANSRPEIPWRQRIDPRSTPDGAFSLP